MVQSDGCTLCDVRGGSVIKEMSFSFATTIAVEPYARLDVFGLSLPE